MPEERAAQTLKETSAVVPAATERKQPVSTKKKVRVAVPKVARCKQAATPTVPIASTPTNTRQVFEGVAARSNLNEVPTSFVNLLNENAIGIDQSSIGEFDHGDHYDEEDGGVDGASDEEGDDMEEIEEGVFDSSQATPTQENNELHPIGRC